MYKCMGMSYKEMKQLLKDRKVPARSRLNQKSQMSDKLIELGYFKSDEEVDALGYMLSDSMKLEDRFDFNALPELVRHNVLVNLNYIDLLQLSSTNKSIKSSCDNDILWKELFEKDFKDKIYVKYNMSWCHLYKNFIQTSYEVIIISDMRLYVTNRGITKYEGEVQMILPVRRSTKLKKNGSAKYIFVYPTHADNLNNTCLLFNPIEMYKVYSFANHTSTILSLTKISNFIYT